MPVATVRGCSQPRSELREPEEHAQRRLTKRDYSKGGRTGQACKLNAAPCMQYYIACLSGEQRSCAVGVPHYSSQARTQSLKGRCNSKRPS
eukprot:1922473-Pleurochrysis_carterae.AAC.1